VPGVSMWVSLCSPRPGFHTQRCLGSSSTSHLFVYRIQLSPSLGPNYVWAFHRECFSSYGFLGHMDMEIEVHERFRRFVRPGDKYVRASYVQ
jgi:hypothetical protein